MSAANPLYIGEPGDRCATCGTLLRTGVGNPRTCPVCPPEPKDAA